MKKLILASNSPRRREILTENSLKFDVISSTYLEHDCMGEPFVTAMTNAEGKAKNVFSKLSDKKNYVVLGADTVVYFNGKILGKPADGLDAIFTLKSLSGKTHNVITGYSIISSKREYTNYSISKVTFNDLSDTEILNYVNTGLPLDKAGSYGIQDGFDLVKTYSGLFSNIVGLPIEDIKRRLLLFLNE